MNNIRKLIPYLSLLLLNVLLVWGVELFTFKYRPGYGISGNGNPGILVLVAAYICFFFLLVVTFFRSSSFFQNPTNRSSQPLLPLLACLLLIFMILGEIHSIQSLREQLHGFTHDEQSVVYRFRYLNQYTNTLYFNLYILIGGICVSSLLSWIIAKIRNKFIMS